LVKQIYILNNDQRQVNTEIKKLNPVDAFSQLHNNIYHRLQIYPMQKQAINFTAISKLAAADQVFSATWHDHDEHTGELSSFIISHLQANG
jgi:cell fate (sporulation/competence/biofilm development) regulator YmcA (YheA/YmcA/DUF963 family)